MIRPTCIICMPHVRTRGSRYSCRTTQIKIFALPVHTHGLIITEYQVVHPVLSEFVFRVCYSGCGWISQLCEKYIYCMLTRYEMRTNLVHTHCFSLVFQWAWLFENAALRLSDVYHWEVRQNFLVTHQLSPFLVHRSIIDPWSSDPTLIGNFYIWF